MPKEMSPSPPPGELILSGDVLSGTSPRTTSSEGVHEVHAFGHEFRCERQNQVHGRLLSGRLQLGGRKASALPRALTFEQKLSRERMRKGLVAARRLSFGSIQGRLFCVLLTFFAVFPIHSPPHGTG